MSISELAPRKPMAKEIQRPHGTLRKEEQCTCPIPDGQITARSKVDCRRHYESLVVEAAQEQRAHADA